MTQDHHQSEPAEFHEDDAQAADGTAEAGAEQPSAPQQAAATPPKAPPRNAIRRPTAAEAAAPKLQPSWILSASGEQLTREEILARYRRQRGLPEDPFANGQRPVPPPGYRDRIMNEPRPARFVERQPQQPEAPPPRQPRTFTLGQTFAIAAAMALVAGGGAGVMSARFSTALPASPAPALATAPAVEAAAAEQTPQLKLATEVANHDTVIDKKPVSTATLQVADVTGETNSFIPLALHAEPAGLDKDILLKISGVPEGAYLTSGHRQDDQVWALSLAETKNVKLVVPKAEEPQIDLAVAAFEPRTGELAAPVKTMTVALKDVVVEPVSGPPPGQVDASASGAKSTLPGADASALPVAIPPPISVALATPETAETQQLIGKADQLFRSGDVKQALKAYERAWGNDGSAAAAFGLARSYDPLVLASLARSNGTPDKDQAIRWYQRAASAGNPDAAEAIVRLQMKP